MLSTLNPARRGRGIEVKRSGPTELGEEQACFSEHEIKESETGGQVFASLVEPLPKLSR